MAQQQRPALVLSGARRGHEGPEASAGADKKGHSVDGFGKVTYPHEHD